MTDEGQQWGELVEHHGWLVSLASAITGDSNDAADVVQDVYLDALRKPADPRFRARSWLAGAVRHSARRLARRRRRTVEREARCARTDVAPAATESELDLFAGALRRAVDGLDEPYRATIRQRYLESRSAAEVAAADGVPVRTVHTRTARGLALLRATLRRDGERERRDWLLTCALVARGRRKGRSWAAAGPAARAAYWAGACLFAAGVHLAVAGARAAPPRAVPVPERSARVDEPDDPGKRVPVTPTEARAAEKPAGVPGSRAPLPAEPRFAGRVVDLDGTPVPGLSVRFETGALESIPGVEFFFLPQGEAPSFDTTDARGAFALACRSVAAGRVIAEDAQLAPVAFWSVEPRARGRRILPVAPRRTFHGRVEDEWGRPLEAVQARFASACPLPAGVDAADLVRAEPAAYTDPSGRFALDAFRAPAELTFRKSGFAEATVPVTAQSDDTLVVVLSREERDFGDDVVRGHVLGPTGQPVRDAVVACGLRMAHVDADGRFVLALKGLRGASLVTAVAPGFCSAVAELDWREPRGQGAYPVVLQLSERALRIEGRAVDEAGRARAGVSVAVADPTPFGIDHQPWFVESFLRGLDRSIFIREVTAEDGSFCIDGLDRRDYRLCLWLSGTLVSTEARVAAGAEPLTVVLRADATRRVRGRVVSAAGEPVAGAEVAPLATVVRVALSPGRTFTVPVSGTPVAADTEGWFELPGVGERCRLRVFGAGIAPREFALPLPEAEPRSYAVDRLVRVRLVREAEPHAHDNLDVLDASGRGLRLRVPSAPLVETWVDRPALTELDAVLEIPESARELLLFHGDAAWARVPLSLRPGEPNTIELPRCSDGGAGARR